jgi:hypothetical protein
MSIPSFFQPSSAEMKIPRDGAGSPHGMTPGKLHVLDVSNPSLPFEVASMSSGLSNPTKVLAQGRYAYVFDAGNSSLVVFDISNPAFPVQASSTVLSGNPASAYILGRYLYITRNDDRRQELPCFFRQRRVIYQPTSYDAL